MSAILVNDSTMTEIADATELEFDEYNVKVSVKKV